MNPRPVRAEAPELEYVNPLCGLCGKEVSHDGESFCCDGCGIYWARETGPGTWRNDTAEQCPATHQPLAKNKYANGQRYQFDTKRCLRDADHEPPHRLDDLCTWIDETAVNGLGPAAEVTP